MLLITLKFNAQTLDSFFSNTTTFLNKNVFEGKVDYLAVQKEIEELDKLIDLSNNINLSNMSDNEFKSFWINIYNLLVIKGITNNLKINSPLDIDGFFDKILYEVGGKNITLNDIENELLRKKFNDPRLHFVLVCGAMGCPVIINEAYLPATIDEQLESQTKLAINDADFIKIYRKKKKVLVSEIFKWYKEDFTINGTEIDFINTYLNNPISSDYNLSYYSYNWNLNIK